MDDEKEFGGEDFGDGLDPLATPKKRSDDDDTDDLLGEDDDLLPLEDEDLFVGGGFDSFDPNY